MFKWKASLIFAVIAALVVALAGLMKDVRFLTIALRSVVGFLAAGALACLVIFLLETKGIVSFEAMAEPTGEDGNPPEGADGEEETASAEEAAGAENEQGEPGEQGDLQDNHEEPEGFQPLDAESLKHMEAPPES
ncbi:MAG: hypothetical protein IJT01_02700 [Selenomonadaceae bacterium]|nr:hypothetical protein [Selenomonadaceae bacterium]